MIRTVITKFGFLRTALAVGVAIPILAGSGAFAQQPAASPADTGPIQEGNAGAIGAAATDSSGVVGGGTAETERIIVTGSNIPTAQEVGPNPVLNINRDLINKSGERTAEELIKNLPVANGGGVPVSNNATGFTPGASAISLRGLGPEATLVLVDGRRLAPYPIGNGGTSSFFDLRSIPEAAIESIEILKDGASTTYGADAVAGVVNIKLRHDYKGAEATVEYGNTLDKDSGEFRASVIFGVGDGTTQITGAANFYHRNSIFNKDRGFSAVPPFLSSNSTPENLNLTQEAVLAAGVPLSRIPVGSNGLPLTSFFGHAPFGSDGTSPALAYTYSGGRTSVFNFNQFSATFPEIENYGGFVNFTHKIFGDQMVLFGDLFYQNTTSHDELAPSATGSFSNPGGVSLAIPPNNQGPELGLDQGAPTRADVGLPADAFNPFNPFQQVISGGSRARLLEFGNRKFDNTTDNFLATIGLKGDKLFDGTWGYDGGFRYNKVKVTAQADLVSTSRFTRILNQADPIFQPGGVLEGQVAFNPFSDANGGTIASNNATTAFATIHPKDVDTSEVATLDLNIYTTSLFKLPAGGVGFAFGGQFRREQLTQDVDQLSIDGDLIGNSPGASTQAGRKDFAFYGETSIPIFSPTFSFPGFYSLELSAAVRYEEFRNNNTNVAVPKFGIRWQPIDESLTIRATIGKGFREPSLIELFGSPTSALSGATDPLPTSLGGPASPVGDPSRFEPEEPVVITSNPNLQPEDSVSFTTGIVFTPKFVPGLTLSVDVWDIERTGVVFAAATQDVLARELNGARGGGGLLPGEIVERDPGTNVISRIFLPFSNSGSLKANGIDFGVQYVYPTNWGTFTSLTNVTWLNSFQFANTSSVPEAEFAGVATDPFAANDGYLKWRGIHRLDWNWNGFDVIGTLRYTDGFHDRKPDGRIHYVSQTWVVDGQASYDFTFVPPVENQPVAGYSKDAKDMSTGKDGRMTESSETQSASYGLPIWQRVLNGTTITLGCDNIFGQDPPKAYGFGGNSTGYPGFLYDATGRFLYVQLTKKF
jgi:iron complex outermembrane recepter protein